MQQSSEDINDCNYYKDDDDDYYYYKDADLQIINFKWFSKVLM